MITIVFHGGARLALPVAPVLIIFAGYALIQGVSQVRQLYLKKNPESKPNNIYLQ
jgi:hypothetical protein